MVKFSFAFWIRVLVFLSIILFISGGLHIADDVANLDFGGMAPAGFALGIAAGFTLQFFATLWTWAGKLYGLIILGLISIQGFWSWFLSHALEVGRGYGALAVAEPEGWAPLFVLGSLFAGVATAAVIIIVVYLLVWGRQLPK